MKIFLFAFFGSLTAYGQTIVTEGPSVSSSAVVVPHHAFQFETGIKYDQGGSTNYWKHRPISLTFPYALLRFGATEKIEIRATGYFISTSSLFLSSVDFGFNKVGIGVKFQILDKPEGPTKIALISHLNFYNRGITNQEVYVNLALSHSLAPNHSIGVNAGVKYNLYIGKFSYSGYASFNSSFIYTAKLNKKLSLFSELFAELNNFSFMNTGCDVGLLFQPLENIQLDCNFGAGPYLENPDFWSITEYHWYTSIGLNVLINN